MYNICLTLIKGVSIADTTETTMLLSSVWLDFIEGRGSIDAVIKEYVKHGFQGNQVRLLCLWIIGYFIKNTYWDRSFLMLKNSGLSREFSLEGTFPSFSKFKSDPDCARWWRSLVEQLHKISRKSHTKSAGQSALLYIFLSAANGLAWIEVFRID